jgi:DNA-binding HxlR family transcriptional regulator
VTAAGVDYSAPFQRAIELIGRRWSGAVIRALLPGPARFNRLLEGIPDISDRMLAERLGELERAGLVDRLVDPGPPIRVSYRLTERGLELRPVVGAIDVWAAREAG